VGNFVEGLLKVCINHW